VHRRQRSQNEVRGIKKLVEITGRDGVEVLHGVDSVLTEGFRSIVNQKNSYGANKKAKI
jgi:hypothetical protein